MYRSFTDRIFGGVCGGLGGLLPVNSWWLRAAFIILAVVTTGAFAALYVLLWWIIPQESLMNPRGGGAWRLLLVMILLILTGAAWAAHLSGSLRTEAGQDLFWPGAALVLSAAFFLKQVGR